MTNQRRILDDNAPENSRSEAQLLVVKIPPWLFAVLVQKGHRKVKSGVFFINAFETLGRDGGPGGLRLRAQIRGPAAACILINVKQELSQVQAIPKDEYQARIHLIAYRSEGVPQISGSQNRHPSCHCGLSYHHHSHDGMSFQQTTACSRARTA